MLAWLHVAGISLPTSLLTTCLVDSKACLGLRITTEQSGSLGFNAGHWADNWCEDSYNLETPRLGTQSYEGGNKDRQEREIELEGRYLCKLVQ